MSMEADRLLAQRSTGWKVGTSVWVALVGLGFVFFSVLGWITGAVLSRAKQMWAWTAMWMVLYAVAIAVPTEESWGLAIFILVWLGSTAHAAYLARGVLRTRVLALARDASWRQPGTSVSPPTFSPHEPPMAQIPLPGVRPQPHNTQDEAPPLPEQRP